MSETEFKKKNPIKEFFWSKGFGYGAILGLCLVLITQFVVPPIQQYYDTDFILDNAELVAKADEGYSQVCEHKSYGHTCIMKKEWHEFSIDRNWFHFDVIGGNGCQYMVENGEVFFDGVEANNGMCGYGGHGTNSAVTTLIQTDEYWITERIDRNPNFYDDYFIYNKQ